MRNAKRFVAILLSLVLAMGLLSACGNDEPNASNVQEPSAGSLEQPSQEPEQSPEISVPPSEAPVQSSEVPVQSPAPQQSEAVRVVEEDYEFEGPGIFETFADYPIEYGAMASEQGTVETVTYHNGTEEKHFNVYLPYGYDSSSDRYNVFYLMHGGNGTPESYLLGNRASGFQRVIDHMIQNGEVEPFILVATTWNSAESKDSGALTKQFAENELAEYVIPLVDGNYRTNATREGRAFGGFSMGSVTTWYTLIYDLAYIKYFVPMSGDCWILGNTAGSSMPAETVAAMEQAVVDQGYTSKDFMIYSFTGTQDYAIPNLAPQIYAMQESEVFVFGENTFFGAYKDATHVDTWTRTYMYNVLPLLWQD